MSEGTKEISEKKEKEADWEQEMFAYGRPSRIASAQQVMLEAPVGAAARSLHAAWLPCAQSTHLTPSASATSLSCVVSPTIHTSS